MQGIRKRPTAQWSGPLARMRSPRPLTAALDFSRMRISSTALMLALLIATQIAGADDLLCAGRDNPIAEDIQIAESDLTFEKAQRALSNLRMTVPNSLETELSYLNSAKIVYGFALRQVALSLKTPRAIDDFCSWLAKDGFRHD